MMSPEVADSAPPPPIDRGPDMKGGGDEADPAEPGGGDEGAPGSEVGADEVGAPEEDDPDLVVVSIGAASPSATRRATAL